MSLNLSLAELALKVTLLNMRLALFNSQIDDDLISRADAEFKEEDHPRAPDGKFGSKSGSSKSKQKEETPKKETKSNLPRGQKETLNAGTVKVKSLKINREETTNTPAKKDCWDASKNLSKNPSSRAAYEDFEAAYTFFAAETENNLSPKEKFSVFDYSVSGYEKINQALVTGNIEDDTLRQKINSISNAIDSCPLPSDVTVYRGIPVDLVEKLFGRLDNLESAIGKCFVNKPFMSTSYKKATTDQFGQVKIKINLKQGTKALPVYGAYEGTEQEILLQKGSVFAIKKFTKDDDGKPLIEVDYVGTTD